MHNYILCLDWGLPILYSLFHLVFSTVWEITIKKVWFGVNKNKWDNVQNSEMATFWRFFSSHYSGKVLWWIASLSTWAQCYQCTSIKMWISIKFLKSKSEYGSQIGSLFENECAFKFRDPKYYLSKHLAEQYKIWNDNPLSTKELSNILITGQKK